MSTLAEARTYDDLQRAMRARAEALNISRTVLDEISGLAAGYSAKVLSCEPMRRLGPATLGSMLQALGLKLLVVEDPESLAQFYANAEQRDSGHVRANASIKVFKWQITNKTARRMHQRWMQNTTPKWREKNARKAVRARWKKVRRRQRLRRARCKT